MALFSREDALARLRAKVAAGQPIVGGGAGTGISAKLFEAGGIDLLVIYDSGRFRMAGRGSLSGLMPYGDANAIVMEMAREMIPVVPRTKPATPPMSQNRIDSQRTAGSRFVDMILTIVETCRNLFAFFA